MRKMWSAVRTKVGLAAIGGALLLTGVGVGTAAATGAIGTQPASDTSPLTTSTSSPSSDSSAAAPTSPTATVAAVTTSQPAPATTSAPAQQVMTVAPGVTPIDPNDLARGGYNSNGDWVPAIGNPDSPEGRMVVPPVPLPSAPKLPGETGYEGSSSSAASQGSSN